MIEFIEVVGPISRFVISFICLAGGVYYMFAKHDNFKGLALIGISAAILG